MPLTLIDVLPNINAGMQNTGFLFGAGTSFEAGYPLMAGLTQTVISALNSSHRAALDEALATACLNYNSVAGEPNIEMIADVVTEHATNSGDLRFLQLESQLRKLVTDAILSIEKPKLDSHVRFLTLLKKRTFGRPSCVWVFTTNYDVLFELAGAYAGVVVETGFAGSIERFFGGL